MKLNIATVVGASAVAAAFLFGGATGHDIATAGASPNNGPGAAGEWDIEVYDNCVAGNGPMGPGDKDFLEAWCCGYSGGVWSGDKCVAPPAKAADAAGSRRTPLLSEPPVIISPTGPARAGLTPQKVQSVGVEATQ